MLRGPCACRPSCSVTSTTPNATAASRAGHAWKGPQMRQETCQVWAPHRSRDQTPSTVVNAFEPQRCQGSMTRAPYQCLRTKKTCMERTADAPRNLPGVGAAPWRVDKTSWKLLTASFVPGGEETPLPEEPIAVLLVSPWLLGRVRCGACTC